MRPGDLLRDLRLALAFNLRHEAHSYNAIQKAMYLGVLLLGVLMVASGVVLWKPIQFGLLTALLGGFDSARIVHFAGMAALLGFARHPHHHGCPCSEHTAVHGFWSGTFEEKKGKE